MFDMDRGVADPQNSKLLWTAISLLCAAFGLAIFTAWVPTFEHLGDPLWTQHQKLHVFREIFLVTVFSGIGIALCFGPLRNGQARSPEAVGLVGFGVVAGFWVGVPVTGVGKNEIAPFLNHGLQAVCLMVGYVLAHYALSGSDKEASESV